MKLTSSALRGWLLIGLSAAPALVFAQKTVSRPLAPSAEGRPAVAPGKMTPRPAATPARKPSVAPVPVDPNRYQLVWQGTELRLAPNGRRYALPKFAGALAEPDQLLPRYQFRLEGPVTALVLTNARYEPFSAPEARLLTNAKADAALPAVPVPTFVTGTERRAAVTFVTLTPLRRNPQTGAVEKLVSFDVTPTFGTAGRPNQARSYATASVLAQGRWIKVGVAASGLYRISRTQLKDLGLDPAGFDARNLQLWGNGGGMLPQPNAARRADDLVENAIAVDEANGAFNSLIFYAQGPHTWRYDGNTRRFRHEQNIYSDSSYYFLTVGSVPGRRVALAPDAGPATAPPLTAYDERAYYELDRVNLLGSGREWYGEELNTFTTNLEIPFTLPGLAPGGTLQLTANALTNVATPNNSTVPVFRYSVNGQGAGTQQSGPPGTDYDVNYRHSGALVDNTFAVPIDAIGSTDPLRVQMTFLATAQSGNKGNLNYLEINAPRTLQRYGAQSSFRSVASVGPGRVSAFQVGNYNSETKVWDITNPLRPQQLPAQVAGATATLTAATDSLREFVVFNPSEIQDAVRGFGVVPNQNLHGFNANLVSPDDRLDLLIVTHPTFLAQANRLAEHRRQFDGLRVAVATTTQVYNEFSSGRQDLTAIRDLMRLLYARTPDVQTRSLHLLLFGDGSFDYKSNQWYSQRPGSPPLRTPNNTNFVPVYESYNSYGPINSFSSEDYLGLLDDDEGTWSESNTSELVDIGIGRLPVTDATAADDAVAKLIRYDAPTSFGKWRNEIAFVADDDGGASQWDADITAEPFIVRGAPTYNVHKIYLDLYPQLTVSSGQRSPATYAALEKTVDQGALLVGYYGHGGETGWTAERILDIPQVRGWRNTDRLAFFLTATCDFGRYDDPRRVSGAEEALLNAQGGAIGLLTTTRPVYSNNNKELSDGLFGGLFTPVGTNAPRLGDLYRRAKTRGNAVNSRNFALLGDPSMRLAYPRQRAVISTINGQAPTASGDTLRALSTVALAGTIQTPDGQLLNNFTGRIQVTVYEKASTILTLGDEGRIDGNGSNQNVIPIQVRESIIYDGVASVTNGQWSTRFVVPKDINYSFGLGKISLYAWSANDDASGANTDIVIGGSDSTALADTTPPAIRLFLNDFSFVSGGTTGQDATLLATLRDSSGINTAGTGIGHEITAILDGKRDNVLALNQYYTADVDSYKSGKVKFLFKGLTPGPHTLTLKAWDTHNNSGEGRLDFEVVNDAKLALDHVLNYPNPFANRTTFHFDHNRAGEDLDVQVQVFTVSGRLIKTLNTRAITSAAHLGDIQWDGRDEYGDVLARGVYVYKVNVRSERDGSHTSKYEKLVILN